MKVIATKCNPSRLAGHADEIYGVDELLSVLARADFVVLAVPLTADTGG